MIAVISRRGLLALALIAGCSVGPVLAQSDVAELVMAQGADPLGFNPTRFSAPNTSFLHQLYDTLVKIGPDGQPTPGLAESWERSADGLKVTFKLRDAKFHSGRAVTAADVVYSVRYHLDEANGANLLARLKTVTDVVAVDDHTVEISLAALTPGIFDLLGATFILDQERADGMAEKDAGSGPFVMTEWRPGISYTMERFADHWSNDETTLDRIVVRIVPDDASAAALLRTGEVDVLYTAGPLALAQIEGVDGLKVDRIERAPRSHYLALNTSRPPLDNKLVRQAISHAMNRDLVSEIVYNGLAAPSCQPWASNHWAYSAEVDTLCSYDLEEAKRLMAESGVAPFTMTVNTSTDAYAPGSVDTAQILKEDFAAIGITLEIATYEPARARELLAASEWDMVLHNYIEGGNDPQFIMPSGIYGPTTGRTKFTSPELVDLITRAGETVDVAERQAIYAEVSRLIVDEAFIMPFEHESRPMPMNDGVAGFAMDGSGFARLQTVTVAD